MEQHVNNNDKRLLARYSLNGSQAAFAHLVARHISLVYSTCYRELGRRELAEEATQAVFIVLARKARGIRSEAALVSWLYTTARFEASVLRRQEAQRMAHERLAAVELLRASNQLDTDAWGGIEPVLNDAIAELPNSDRQAILLRFFEEKSLQEVGAAMGSSDDAAQKRVTRALDKLRALLLQKKTADVSSAALAALLTSHAVHAVPSQVAASVTASASSAFAISASGHTVLTLNSVFAKGLALMSTTKAIAVTVAAAAVVLALTAVVVVHHAHAASPVQWTAPRADDLATQTAERQIQAQFDRYTHGYNSRNVSEILSVISPDCIEVMPSAPPQNAYISAKSIQFPFEMDVKVKIRSCRIIGTTAVVGMEAFTHYRPTGKNMYRDEVDTIILSNISGQWLMTRIEPISRTNTEYPPAGG